MTVTVFTKPHCPQCDATKRQLTKLGVPFETVDLTQNPSTLEQLQAAGFQQAPVVITPDNSWTGYRPDLIREVAQQVAADNRALNYDKFVVKGEVRTMADDSYTSHNTNRLDVEGTVKKILTTEYVQNALKEMEAEKA